MYNRLKKFEDNKDMHVALRMKRAEEDAERKEEMAMATLEAEAAEAFAVAQAALLQFDQENARDDTRAQLTRKRSVALAEKEAREAELANRVEKEKNEAEVVVLTKKQQQKQARMKQAEERVAQIEALRREKAQQAKEEKDRRSAAALAAKALATGKKEAKLLEIEKKRMEAEERRELFAQVSDWVLL